MHIIIIISCDAIITDHYITMYHQLRIAIILIFIHHIILTIGVFSETRLVEDHKNSIFFVESNVVYTTQSKWLTTFFMDIHPYETYIITLLEDINILENVIKHYRTYHHWYQTEHLKEVEQYLRLCKVRLNVFHGKLLEFKHILSNIRSLINPLSDRSKRALFSFLGDLLQGLTGVATEKDIKSINDHLKQLHSNDVELAHIVENGMTVVNATHIKLLETIHTVNSLNQVTNILQQNLANFTTTISVEV